MGKYTFWIIYFFNKLIKLFYMYISYILKYLGKGLKAIFQSTNDSGEQTQDDNCTDKK